MAVPKKRTSKAKKNARKSVRKKKVDTAAMYVKLCWKNPQIKIPVRKKFKIKIT